jgi:hypothetical protein
MSNYITESKQINLSSNSAIISNAPLNSVLTFKTNGVLKKEKEILYNLISVVHAEIPVSYYIVNDTNNLLSMSTGNYNLTNGNYNATTFKTMLLFLLGANWTLNLNSTTGIFTLAYTTNFTINATSTCYKLMGFKKNTSYVSVSNSLTFIYPCNFLGVQRLKIKSNVLKTHNIDSYLGGHSNLLTTIPVNSASYGLIVFSNLVGFKTILPNTSIDFIDITITDELDNIINFNGIDIYITLQIDTIRESLPDEENLLTLLNSQNNN